MKAFILLTLILLSSCINFGNITNTANWPLDETTGWVAASTPMPYNFTQLIIAGNLDVELTSSGSLQILLPPEAVEIIQEANGVVIIRSRQGFNPMGPAQLLVRVPVNGLQNLTVTTNRRIFTETALTGANLNLNLGGAVSGTIESNVTNLALNVSSPSPITLMGNATNFTLETGSNVRLNLRRFNSVNRQVNVGFGGRVNW
ncbi:MAG: DUF2807 domain-containing protein [Spirochaetaceae bacterium]|nr:DUF2807 domain-containing protein [Spirochaetaceae bacterium]